MQIKKYPPFPIIIVMSTLDERYRRFVDEEEVEEKEITFYQDKLSQFLYLSKLSRQRSLNKEEMERYAWAKAFYE